MTVPDGPSEVPRVQRLSGDLFLLDTQHMGLRGTVGVYLVPGPAGRFALVETGPGSTLETVEAGVQEAGFELHKLTAVLVTHIHLDHAGAAGTLARRYGAEVYVHESGAAHMLEPSRLLTSAARVYGDQLEALWGTMEGTPQAQVRPVRDEDRLEVVGREFRVLYTPGHASSHVSYLLNGDTLFTGDAAAIRLSGVPVVKPATAPPEVNLEGWEGSLDAMLAADPKRLLLTHFGEVTEPRAHLERVREQTRAWAATVLEGLRAGEDEGALAARIRALAENELRGVGASAETIRKYEVTSDSEMTASGLKRYWLKHHPERLTRPIRP